MKKSVVICIAIVYIASVVVISFFGMKVAVYNKDIPVTSVACINENDAERGVSISQNSKGEMVVSVKFTTPADTSSGTPTGTILQLFTRVAPDNASNKDVKFVYTPNSNIEFYKIGDKENGLILFYAAPVSMRVTIMADDGRNASTQIIIRSYI